MARSPSPPPHPSAFPAAAPQLPAAMFKGCQAWFSHSVQPGPRQLWGEPWGGCGAVWGCVGTRWGGGSTERGGGFAAECRKCVGVREGVSWAALTAWHEGAWCWAHLGQLGGGALRAGGAAGVCAVQGCSGLCDTRGFAFVLTLLFLPQWLAEGCSPAGRTPTISSAAMLLTPIPAGWLCPPLAPPPVPSTHLQGPVWGWPSPLLADGVLEGLCWFVGGKRQ